MHDLWTKFPNSIVVSGGADGVDTMAERTWLGLGGAVWSYRARKLTEDSWGVEKWELGIPHPRVIPLSAEPTFADKPSALFYRNSLIAEACTRLVLFHKPRWRGGGGYTEELARLWGKPTYVYECE